MRRFRFSLRTFLLLVLVTPALIYLVYVYTRPQPEIVVALTSRDRNHVFVAMHVLRKDGINVSEQIDIFGPFAKAQPALTELVNEVRNLDDKRLETLDRAYAARLYIHSPYDPYWE